MQSVQHSAWHTLGRQHMLFHGGHSTCSDEGLSRYCIPHGTAVKNPPASEEMQEMWVQSPGREDPLEWETAAHSNMLTWKIHGQRSWVHGVARVRYNWALTELENYTLCNFHMVFKSYLYASLSKLERLKWSKRLKWIKCWITFSPGLGW